MKACRWVAATAGFRLRMIRILVPHTQDGGLRRASDTQWKFIPASPNAYCSRLPYSHFFFLFYFDFSESRGRTPLRFGKSITTR